MNDGFYILQSRQKYNPVEDDNKSKNQKKIKFKKSSWKHWLYHKLKNWNPFSKNVKDFHFSKLSNYLVCIDGDKSQCSKFQKALDSADLKKLEKKYSNCAVLINAYDDIFMKLSIKSYLKLCKIEKMIMSKSIKAYFDSDEEDYDVIDQEIVIDNINELCYQISFHRFTISGIDEIQANAYGFTDYVYKFKILIIKTDGNVETYKGDMNSFMKSYDMKLF